LAPPDDRRVHQNVGGGALVAERYTEYRAYKARVKRIVPFVF